MAEKVKIELIPPRVGNGVINLEEKENREGEQKRVCTQSLKGSPNPPPAHRHVIELN